MVCNGEVTPHRHPTGAESLSLARLHGDYDALSGG